MQTTTTRNFLAQSVLALAVTLCLSLAAANAGTINHGDFMGPNVGYMDVTETSADPVPLYGAPIVIGDMLAFFEPSSSNPSLGFNAQSAGGIGDITDGFLNLTIMAKPGKGINALTFSEGGDYTMSALGNALAQVSATLNIFQLSIVEVDNAPLGSPIVLSDIQSTTLNFPGDPAQGSWNLSSTFDLAAAVASLNPSLGVTKIVAKVNNTLTALSQSGSVAGIFKKDFDIDPDTTIPEPTTMMLSVFGLIGVLATRRAS